MTVIDLTHAPARPIRVMVVEDEPLARAALIALVASDRALEVAGGAATVTHALELAAYEHPDVVLCDLFLDDGDACGLALRLQRLDDPPAVVVATLFATPSAAAACVSAGALTVLEKDVPPEVMLAAVRAAGDRRAWHGHGSVRPLARHHLTYLESLVLAELASGATNDEIADALGYSANYVKDVLASARERLGARDRAHAAALAVALRLVRPRSDGRFAPALPMTEGALTHVQPEPEALAVRS